MKKALVSYVLITASVLFSLIELKGQYLRNPSLEGPEYQDGQPDYWESFPEDDGSDPNFYPEYTVYDGSKTYTPIDGNTFTLYRSRGTTYAESHHFPVTREYSFQELIKPLEPNSCFMFEAHLAFHPSHQVIDSDPELENKAFPLVFKVWGGNENNVREELLIESEPIANEDWEKYTFYFNTQETAFAYIMFEVYWDTINIRPEPYNSMMLIDNLKLERLLNNQEPKYDTLYYRGDGLTQLTAGEGTKYVWEPEGFLANSETQTSTIFHYHDKFKVWVYQEGACPSEEEFVVLLHCDTLYPEFIHRRTDLYYKYEKNIILEASTGNIYDWTPKVNLSAYDIQSPYMLGYSGEYTVDITRIFNQDFQCQYKEQFNIILQCDTLYPEKSIVVMDSIIDGGETVELIPRYGWPVSEWTPSAFLSCHDCQNPIARPETKTQFKVELEDNFACFHEEVFLIDIELEIPNVITPNNDGYNDCFKIYGLPGNSKLYIYTKNGELLYQDKSYSIENCWEGIDMHGKKLETGTYWYIIKHDNYGTIATGYIFVKQ